MGDLSGFPKVSSVVAINSGYGVTAVNQGNLLKVTASGGAVTISLATVAALGNGFNFWVFRDPSSDSDVIIDPAGAENINNGATYTLSTKQACVGVTGDGAEWFVVAQAGVSSVTAGESGSFMIGLQTLGTPDYTTLNDFVNIAGGAGLIFGGTLSDGGSQTVDYTEINGLIRSTDSHVGQLFYFKITAGSTDVIPTDTIRYIGVQYNAGTPQVFVNASDSWDWHTDFPLGSVVNEGDVLFPCTNPVVIVNHPSHTQERFYETEPWERANRLGGLILGETGVRKMTLTASEIYDRANEFDIAAIDTNVAGSFDSYSSAGLESSNNTQWDNDNYDNGGVLTSLTASKFAVLWFYLDVCVPELLCVYGTGQYAIAGLAEEESVPGTLPDRVVAHGKLLGRIIFQKGAGAATEIQSVFTTTFSAAGITVHNELSSLQGGTANEYYHLTAAEYTGTGTGNFVRLTSPTLVTPTLGVAIATTINKVTITTPATGSTLTIAEGKTLTCSADVTLDVDVGGIGIADDDLVQIDHAAVADNDYAKFTANGLEGRSYAEVGNDIGVSTPIYWNMLTAAPDVVGQGTWIREINATLVYGSQFRNNVADGDNFTINFRCPVGTYTLRFNAGTAANRGMIDITIDGDSVESGVDFYVPGSDNTNIYEKQNISISAGSHALKFTVNGKNGASSNYYFTIQGINLQRTA